MNELVERRAATAGTAVAGAVVGTIPDFRSKEGAGEKVLSSDRYENRHEKLDCGFP